MFSPSSSVRAQEPSLGLFESNYVVLANPTPKTIGAPSYYDEVGDGGNLVTEAQIVTHFRWIRGLTPELLREGQSGWKTNLLFTFQFRMRALQDASAPIRSPSFMPRLTAQLMKAYGGGTLLSPNTGRRNVLGFVGVLGHHSNGGDGCVFQDEAYDATGTACIAPSPLPALDTRAVRSNGNFTTNYVQVGFFHRMASAEEIDGRARLGWSIDMLLSTQFHTARSLLFSGTGRQFGKLYGRIRPRVDLAVHRMIPLPIPTFMGSGATWALRGRAMYERFSPKVERYPGALNYRFEAEVMLQPVPPAGGASRVNDVMIGLRYVRGMDACNTQFVRDIERLQFIVGIAVWSPWL